jgi:peroxiredoxin
MRTNQDLFPDFFYETYDGAIFTNNSFKNKYLLIFFLVHIASKKDQHRLLLFTDLIDDLYRLKPSSKKLLQCIAISSDTISAMKKNQGILFNVFPILSCSDQKLFKEVNSLSTFSFFSIKASEPKRNTFLLRPDRSIVWIWENDKLPPIDHLIDLMSSNNIF